MHDIEFLILCKESETSRPEGAFIHLYVKY